MNVLEKILEEMLNYERVVKTDEDLEWNRAMYRCSEIIRSHMDEAKDINVPSNDGWIPVEERLPDGLNKELYDINLVTLEDGEVCIGVYRDDKKEWWTRRKKEKHYIQQKHNVIAWQPLPKPYKPKQ